MSVRTGFSGPLLLLAVAFGLAAPLSAGVIYNNFPAAPNENTYGLLPMLVGRQSPTLSAALAAPFTPTADNEFAWVRLAAFSSSTYNHFTLTLCADNGGLPGAALESISDIALPSLSTLMPSTFQSTVNTLLKAGVQYWVVLDRTSTNRFNTTSGRWYYAAGEVQGTYATRASTSQEPWRVANATMSLEVGGLRDAVVTPEPAAWALGAGGMLALMCMACMRRKQNEER